MYSMFSEALRLIPPEGYQITDKRKRAVSTEREQSPDRKKSCSTGNHTSDSDTRARDIKRESHESSTTTHETDATRPAFDHSSYVTSSITPRDDIMTIARNTGAGMFWELDALLRF
jgi:hypothetical protein